MWDLSPVVPDGALLSSSEWDHDVSDLLPDTTYAMQVHMLFKIFFLCFILYISL